VASQPEEVLRMHREEPVPSLAAYGVSLAVEAIIKKLLEKDPSVRTASAREVVNRLSELR
jgi:hypothetical protein